MTVHMTDADLDHVLTQAFCGEHGQCMQALAEMCFRLREDIPLTETAIKVLAAALARVALSSEPARFLFPHVPKRGKGRPRHAGGPIFQTAEHIALAKARQEGFKDNSNDRATTGKRSSSYLEAAKRLGASDGDVERVAERIARSSKVLRRKAGLDKMTLPVFYTVSDLEKKNPVADQVAGTSPKKRNSAPPINKMQRVKGKSKKVPLK